ncbi:hypothetical protein WH297_19275 [Ochrobactrum vermis]|uniref:Tail fiber protein n=1 Tax=Ochrobactrum vermis TaxID=1827297 RepID=A0ABU8PK75_9HYPH|nr:hypothetical protein [Ochrobactrum vermis]PQZ26170.1 hypothetical protein CQZ93_19575 [Ochrobactrum vermis]
MVTITASTREAFYNPVVPTTDFPVNYPIFGKNVGEFPATDLQVEVNGELRTDFTIIADFNEGISTNAVVRMNVAIAGFVTVRGRRNPRRTDQYMSGAPLRIPDHNYSLNRLEAEMQEVRRDADGFSNGLKDEITARIAGDAALNNRINQEIIDRQNGDTALASLIGQGGPISEHIFETNLAVGFAQVKPGFSSILTLGRTIPGDGDGGLYIATNSGSSDTIVSGDGRTWYKFEDIMPSRLKTGQEVAFQKKLKLRERLWSDRNYYVRPDGNDTNDGSSNASNRAFKTINRARQEVYGNIDLNGFTAYVNIYDGTYTETVYCVGQPVGQGANPTPVVFRGIGAALTDVNVAGGFQSLSGARVHLTWMKLDPLNANNYCMFARGVGSFISGDNLQFGQCGTPGASVTDHMMATDGAGLEITGPYSITGGALNHYHCTEGAFMRIAGQVVSLFNTPNFNGQFAGVASSSLFVIGVAYSGPATGRTYLVHYNGVIRANLDTRNVFPGNIHGVERSGGRLDAASMFSAHKNGANQVVTNGNWVKLTMPALQFTYGGDYDTTNNRWNPRAGEVAISATVTLSSVAGADQILGVSIFKSGVEFKSALLNSSGANGVARSICVTVRDTTDGSAYYELFVRGGDAGSSTVSGNAAWTHWSGRQY